jgi:hypothetical protein
MGPLLSFRCLLRERWVIFHSDACEAKVKPRQDEEEMERRHEARGESMIEGQFRYVPVSESH